MSPQINGLRTPKQNRTAMVGMAGWYEYYAGYSPLFVEDMLHQLNLPVDGIILDPWNGAGTTTQVAQDRGIPALGYDLNPSAVIVAKARKLHSGVLGSIRSLTAEISDHAVSASTGEARTPEPLELWFTGETAEALRRLEIAIQRLLVCHASYVRIVDLSSLAAVSDLAAFFYTALFKVTRSLLAPFKTSNPTWVKLRKNTELQIHVDRDEILSRFQLAVASMMRALEDRRDASGVRCEIDISQSTALPIQSDSVSGVITSPPYCTRIDYAITTSPELAILGMDLRSELKPFRDRMLGTSTITGSISERKKEWGPTCTDLLYRIESHPSKAAKSYYLKTYLQYFNGLSQSIREIARVLQRGRPAAIVVQDSYFKDVHVDLAGIVSEMGSNSDLYTARKLDFPARRTMCGVHKHALKYRTLFVATESVVTMVKN
jgi:DNA modification methylase